MSNKFKQFQQFICMVRNDPDELVDIRCIHDKNKDIKPISRIFTVAELLLERTVEWLTEMNNRGYGIFAGVNLGEKLSDEDKSFKVDNIVDVTAYFIDADPEFPDTVSTEEERSEYIGRFKLETLNLLKEFPIEPSCINETGKGIHAYYLRMKQDGENIDSILSAFSRIQRRFISYFKSDDKVKDLPRVMRVPGFYHMKGEPFMVEMIDYHPENEYTVDQIEAVLPLANVSEKSFDDNCSNISVDKANINPYNREFTRLIGKIGIENVIPELSPEYKGSYYVLDCPRCKEHEAFIYSNNLTYLICNRKTNCKFEGGLIEYLKEREKFSMNPDVVNYLKRLAGENNNQRGEAEQLLPLDMDEYGKAILSSPSVLSSGYESLDKMIKGFRSGCLSIIGARTRSGKSTFIYNIILNILENSDKVVALYSYEIPRQQVITKLLTILIKRMHGKAMSFDDIEYEYKKCYDGDFSKLPIEMQEAKQKLDGYKDRLLLCDNPSVDIEDLSEYVKNKASHIGCLFVDYTELVNATSTGSEEQRISKIVTDMRKLSMDLNIPVITLSQINRENANKSDKKKTLKIPPLEGLRYSGRQEHEATLVLTLLNEQAEKAMDISEDCYDISDETLLYVAVIKNRYGKPNQMIKMEFDMKSGDIKVINEDNIVNTLKEKLEAAEKEPPQRKLTTDAPEKSRNDIQDILRNYVSPNTMKRKAVVKNDENTI